MASTVNSENFKYSILNIHLEKMIKIIKEVYEDKRNDIIKKDEIQKIFKNAKNKLEKVFNEQGMDMHRYCLFDSNLMTEQTNESLKKLKEQYDCEIKQQTLILHKVDGLLELADTYEQRVDILKKHDILSEEGNYFI